MKVDNKVVLQKLKDRNISLIGTLENYRTRKTFVCNKGHQWECTAYDIIERQHTCAQCGWDTILNNQLIDDKINRLNNIRKTDDGMRKREAIHRIGEYKNHKSKIEWECLVDKHRWLSTPHDILFRGVGCPLCHVKSETIVYLLLHDKLQSLGIKTDIIRQKELCNYDYQNQNKNRTAYGDFWFQLNGETYLIEYNGKQHYELVFFGSTTNKTQAEEKLKKQQFRDQVVKDYAVQNKIKLFIIDGRKISGEKKVKSYIDKLFE
jgi:hypothetical protein